jgi:hypothetical protein
MSFQDNPDSDRDSVVYHSLFFHASQLDHYYNEDNKPVLKPQLTPLK